MLMNEKDMTWLSKDDKGVMIKFKYIRQILHSWRVCRIAVVAHGPCSLNSCETSQCCWVVCADIESIGSAI